MGYLQGQEFWWLWEDTQNTSSCVEFQNAIVAVTVADKNLWMSTISFVVSLGGVGFTSIVDLTSPVDAIATEVG